MKSLTREWKVGKALLYMMLRELSADSVTIPIRPDVPIGMK